MIKFYEKHKKAIKLFAGVAVVALVVTVLLFGSPDYTVNP